MKLQNVSYNIHNIFVEGFCKCLNAFMSYYEVGYSNVFDILCEFWIYSPRHGDCKFCDVFNFTCQKMVKWYVIKVYQLKR